MSAVICDSAMYMHHLITTSMGQGFIVIPIHRGGSRTMKVKSWFKVTWLEGAELGFKERLFLTLGIKLLITAFTCSSKILEPFRAPWERSAPMAPF